MEPAKLIEELQRQMPCLLWSVAVRCPDRYFVIEGQDPDAPDDGRLDEVPVILDCWQSGDRRGTVCLTLFGGVMIQGLSPRAALLRLRRIQNLFASEALLLSK